MILFIIRTQKCRWWYNPEITEEDEDVVEMLDEMSPEELRKTTRFVEVIPVNFITDTKENEKLCYLPIQESYILVTYGDNAEAILCNGEIYLLLTEEDNIELLDDAVAIELAKKER